MYVAGVLVQALPGQAAQVTALLTQLPGVEIHAVNPAGKLVLTVEEEEAAQISERVLNLHRLAGVLSAAMIYQYGEDDDALTAD